MFTSAIEGAPQQHLQMWRCDDGEASDRPAHYRIGERRPGCSAQGLLGLEGNGVRSDLRLMPAQVFRTDIVAGCSWVLIALSL